MSSSLKQDLRIGKAQFFILLQNQNQNRARINIRPCLRFLRVLFYLETDNGSNGKMFDSSTGGGDGHSRRSRQCWKQFYLSLLILFCFLQIGQLKRDLEFCQLESNSDQLILHSLRSENSDLRRELEDKKDSVKLLREVNRELKNSHNAPPQSLYEHENLACSLFGIEDEVPVPRPIQICFFFGWVSHGQWPVILLASKMENSGEMFCFRRSQ